MKNFRFYQSQIANKFWLPKGTKIDVVEFCADSGCFHVCFVDIFNHVIDEYLTLEDIKCVRLCVYLSFGAKSYTFEQWHDLFKELQSLSNEKL